MNRRKFIPEMLTPFNDDGSIDYIGLTYLTDFYLNTGAKGLLANSFASEVFELDKEEQLQLVKHVLKTVDGRVPLLVTVSGGQSIEDQAAFTNQLYALGVDAVFLITSLIANEADSEEEMDEKIFRFLELTPGVPLGFYECFIPYKRLLSADQLARYAVTKRIVYFKDASRDINSINAKLDAVRQDDFELYETDLSQAVQSLNSGAAGLSSIQGNYFPELIDWLCMNFSNSDLRNKVSIVEEFLIANMDVLQYPFPITAKYFLQKGGFPISLYTRHGDNELTDDIKEQADELFSDYQQLRSELEI